MSSLQKIFTGSRSHNHQTNTANNTNMAGIPRFGIPRLQSLLTAV